MTDAFSCADCAKKGSQMRAMFLLQINQRPQNLKETKLVALFTDFVQSLKKAAELIAHEPFFLFSVS